MNEGTSWLISIAIHLVMLLGGTAMVFEYFIGGAGGDPEGSGFSCTLGTPAAKFDRIERSKDQFTARIPSSERSAMTEGYADGGPYAISGIRESNQGGWSTCCECGCGGAATTLVAWPRDTVGYFDRKLSMATSRLLKKSDYSSRI